MNGKPASVRGVQGSRNRASEKNDDTGFTYFAALMMIVIVSASLMTVHKQWSTLVKRDREKELFFRAQQIVDAIGSYYGSSSAESQRYPKNFNVLLKDNRFAGLKKHLRRPYKDPMTAEGDWGYVFDGRGGIKGVYSKSGKEPLKKGNFPLQYKSFENKKRYSDWKFVYEPEKKEVKS